MSFLPFETFTITTNLTPDEVRKRLSDVIESPQPLGFWSPFGKPYEGEISGDNFEIKKIPRFSKSMPPVVQGKIIPEALGCKIIVEIKPPLGITIIGTLFLVFFLVMIAGSMSGMELLFVLFLLYCLILILFETEAERDKKFLENLFSS
jgi:hypothetical protein